ncbi:ATP/GTP-binding protein [Sulfurisphaera ohwakuensis]|uniref:AAA family ATPase n=1 Tax=Sulfurisphaera ohwakuensis TaxID=69656 RepID=UPI0036F32556
MLYRVKGKQGLLIIDFDAKGYYVLDDNKRILNAYGEKGKLYVDVNTKTRYVYLFKANDNEYPKDKVFTLSYPEDFKMIKFEECERKSEIKNKLLLDNEKNSLTYLYSRKEVKTPLYLELSYCYEGEADNLLLGLFAENEPDTVPECHGKMLGGCSKYYSKGSIAVGFDPHYSRTDLIVINEDGKCETLKTNKDLTGCHNLKLLVSDKIDLWIDDFGPLPFKISRHQGSIYLVANSGDNTARVNVNFLNVYEGEVTIVDKVEKAGFSEVEIENFRGIAYGKLNLDRVNVIIGANNAGKTTILDAIYLLSDPKQKPPGFNTTLELLAYLHNVKKGNKFIYRFYNTASPPMLRGDEIKYDDIIRYVESEKSNEVKALYLSPRLMSRYIKFIKDNWEEISNYTEIFNEIFNEINEINVEEYLTMTLEPFGGTYTFYLIRKDGKRVRLYDVGEGVKIYIISRILYEYLKPSIILWDDIESHLNPSLLGKVIAWFSDIPSQVVVTTHNLEVAKDIAKDGKCIVVDIDKDGTLRVKEIQDLEEYLKLGLDPRAIIRAIGSGKDKAINP